MVVGITWVVDKDDLYCHLMILIHYSILSFILETIPLGTYYSLHFIHEYTEAQSQLSLILCPRLSELPSCFPSTDGVQVEEKEGPPRKS